MFETHKVLPISTSVMNELERSGVLVAEEQRVTLIVYSEVLDKLSI